MDELERRTRQIFTPGKGILALDTPPTTLAERFRAVAVVHAEPSTDAYRTMLLETPDLDASTSAVVLPPEAFSAAPERADVLARLREARVVAGVRADTGHETLSAHGRESVTSGLDGLAGRLDRLRDLGAGFAVWSVCTSGGSDMRALTALTANSQAAARFAYTCQDLGLVPVVRVGTRMRAATPGRRRAVLAAALLSVSGHLDDLDVERAATVVCAPCEPHPHGHPVADGPLAALPPRLGGVALTTAGVGAPSAADMIAAVREAGPPWPVTFYLGQEATRPALHAWRGSAAGVRAGQRALLGRLAAASAALAAPRRPLLVAVPAAEHG